MNHKRYKYIETKVFYAEIDLILFMFTTLFIVVDCLTRIHSTASLPSLKSVTPQDHQMLKEQFWDKNKRLNRPISPHLTIYKPQMTSMLSITHRGTGLAQSVILTGFGVGAIASGSTFPVFLAYLQSWKFGGALIFLGKFAIAWPVTYHLFNGLRHLVRFLTAGRNERC